MQTNFSVDDFLHNYRYSATLETFRDDLGIYLKILRSAMIELINEDYADFVNLSSNLVNLDKSINILKDPLVQLREEVLNVRANLQDCMNEINECLNEKRRFRQIRKSLGSLESTRKNLSKIRSLMALLNTDDKERAVLLERIALELIQLQFNVKFCSHFLSSNEKSLIDEQEEALLTTLGNYFLSTLEDTSNIEGLERCLRIYYILDKCKLVEDIFRRETAVYMETIINEKNLQKNPDNLAGVFNQILDFVSLKMKQLLSLTRGKTVKVKGYNFLFNSFWSAVEERIETSLSSIFSPGIPNDFYVKFKCTMEFLKRIEMIIDDPVLIKKFHEHEQYKKFQKRWNLPVYFQIRNQEISTSLEKYCEINFEAMEVTPTDSNQIQTKLFVEVINCIATCWKDGIFIDQLYSNFLKLTLQLVSRGVRWTKDVLKQTSENGDNLKIDLQTFYAVLYRDIGTFILKFPQIEELLGQKLKENLVLKDKIDMDSIRKCFEPPREAFNECQRNIESQIVRKLMESCLKSIKNVQDIPRLFRKTNREVPTKHLPYVDQILQPIDDFIKAYSQYYQPEVVQRILKELFSKLTIQYYQSVSEVLTSVQRTEESLRRLKNLKKSQSSTVVNDEKQLMSDDDKIRLQLQIDIMQYVKSVEGHGLKRDEIDSLLAIISLIGDITKVKLAVN